MIQRFLERVKFDPVTLGVHLIDDPNYTWTTQHVPVSQPMTDTILFERIINQSSQDRRELLTQYANPFGPAWSQVPVFSGILARSVPVTQLTVRNGSGFNEDCRSHRGDDLSNDVVIPATLSSQPDPTNDYDSFYIGTRPAAIQRYNFVLALDKATYQPVWRTTSPTGITWGQVMEGVMRVKGSKFDRWYELFTGVQVSFPTPDSVELELTFDHGS